MSIGDVEDQALFEAMREVDALTPGSDPMTPERRRLAETGRFARPVRLSPLSAAEALLRCIRCPSCKGSMSVASRQHPYMMTTVLEFSCHGQMDRLEVSDEALESGDPIDVGRAIAEKMKSLFKLR